MLCDGPGETHAILAGGYALVADVYDHLVDEIGMRSDVVSRRPRSAFAHPTDGARRPRAACRARQFRTRVPGTPAALDRT